MLQFCTWVLESGRRGNGNVWCQRARRWNINGKEGAIGREMATDFFHIGPKHGCNMLEHHLVRPGCLRVSGAVRRRRGNDVGSAASMVIGQRWRARGNEDGGGGVGHVIDLVGVDLS